MELQDLFDHVNAAYRGSDDNAPATGTPDYTQWLLTANRLQRRWATDPKNLWSSLFEIRDLGTIAAGTQTYEFDDEFIMPADKVIVTTTDSTPQQLRYVLIKPEERFDTFRAAYISGRDPQTLTFTDTFVTDTQPIGGILSLGAYWLPDDLVSATDTINVDDPYWLVLATASELAGNDITYSDKAVDLNSKADELYRQMSLMNRRGTYNNPRVTPTNVRKIRSAQGSWYSGGGFNG